mmetsp:Transcript_22560/g.37670  ORF Transcript_22560/g.37670 Transcript_22560/m.37670 type:complete len:352 (-) Transcript_22560:525-1580(-)
MINYLLVLLAFLIYAWILCTKEDENVFVKRVLNKLQLFFNSVYFMVLSKDNKGIGPKKNPDPDLIKDKINTTKRIVFIRHGESDWNNVFNKGINISFIFRLVKALYAECRMLSTDGSSFIDSPLNQEGIEQAVELSKWLKNESDGIKDSDPNYHEIMSLAGKISDGSSIIVSSCLRRSIATTTLALWPRLAKTGEKVHILSSLQEISRNVDTYAISTPHTVADLPFDRLTPHCQGKDGTPFDPLQVYEASQNFGTKRLDFYGIKRLRAFGDWAMQQSEDLIIVGGHSLWFKCFFQTFLPHGVDHDAKKKKITNSGAVAFTLQVAKNEQDGTSQYRIDPASLRTVYGGYTAK